MKKRANKPATPTARARRLRVRTVAKQRAFLAAFAELGVISGAAKVAGIDRGKHYKWMAKDPRYVAAFDDASERACDVLEAEARRRGADGWDEPVYWQGRIVGHVRRYSDRMLELMLKARRPKVFRETVEHTGAGGSPITVRVVYDNSD